MPDAIGWRAVPGVSGCGAIAAKSCQTRGKGRRRAAEVRDGVGCGPGRNRNAFPTHWNGLPTTDGAARKRGEGRLDPRFQNHDGGGPPVSCCRRPAASVVCHQCHQKQRHLAVSRPPGPLIAHSSHKARAPPTFAAAHPSQAGRPLLGPVGAVLEPRRLARATRGRPASQPSLRSCWERGYRGPEDAILPAARTVPRDSACSRFPVA